MSGYSLEKKDYDKNLDLTKLRPYGDSLNDGRVQLSFTLPVKNDSKGKEAALLIAKNMGLSEVQVVHQESLDDDFSFYIVYGCVTSTVNYEKLEVTEVEIECLSMDEVDNIIDKKLGREIVIVGASTGSDAHTVGIDAIMNMKGFAGHYGLERYKNFKTYNMGSQVTNEELIKKAKEVKADVILISQTVTQNNIHIQNLTQFTEIAELENLRDNTIILIGGSRISNTLAKELGYDAGFGNAMFASHVATFIVDNIDKFKI